MEGVKGVQLAKLGLESWKDRRWLDVPDLKFDLMATLTLQRLGGGTERWITGEPLSIRLSKT